MMTKSMLMIKIAGFKNKKTQHHEKKDDIYIYIGRSPVALSRNMCLAAATEVVTTVTFESSPPVWRNDGISSLARHGDLGRRHMAPGRHVSSRPGINADEPGQRRKG